MLPLSPEPMRSSTGNSIESVEQPWHLSGFTCLSLSLSDPHRSIFCCFHCPIAISKILVPRSIWKSSDIYVKEVLSCFVFG